jgi:tetratricopeptide (TPR) repeat protein
MVSNPSASLERARGFLRQNRLADAEVEVQAALALDPNGAESQILLGVIHLKRGRADLAVEILGPLVAADPLKDEAVGLLAVAHKNHGDFAAAAELFKRLASRTTATADVFNQLGACQLELGDAVSAGKTFKRAVELDRTCAASYYNLGMALKANGPNFEAFGTFQRAISLDPNFLDAYFQLWQQMRHLLNWRHGLPMIEQGLRMFPNSARMMMVAATTFGKVGRADRAEALFKSAVANDPSYLPTYGHWLQEEGRFEEAVPLLHESIFQNPIQGQPYYNLAVGRRFEVGGVPVIDAVLPLIEDPRIDDENRMFLHYAAAHAFDHARDYEHAIRQYDAANEHAYRLYNASIDYDVSAVEAEHAVLTELYTAERLSGLIGLGSESEAPIFIVGMIRTGTTLLDQILSSHPSVGSAGEQPFWRVSAGRVNRLWRERGPRPEDLKEISDRYLAVLRESAGEQPSRVTDKMPTNFMHVGLMTAAFPRAKFIHTRRSPLDTCLSIYTTFFGNGTQFAYHKRNIVEYYLAYLRTMELWRSVLPPGRMIEIDYEDLVSDREGVLREVLAFCGLDWDDSVLSHEQNRSHVSTPSLWTARQPVNTRSVERWKRYEPWLGELLELREVAHPDLDRASVTR